MSYLCEARKRNGKRCTNRAREWVGTIAKWVCGNHVPRRELPRSCDPKIKAFVIWLYDEQRINIKHWLLRYFRETTKADRNKLAKRPLNYRG